jgi:hypothetical protein
MYYAYTHQLRVYLMLITGFVGVGIALYSRFRKGLINETPGITMKSIYVTQSLRAVLYIRV